MRSTAICVAARLVPSGVRTSIWNCASSFLGRKALGTALISGTIETSVPSAASTTSQRWRSENRSIAM